jgi:hypothetical protein
VSVSTVTLVPESRAGSGTGATVEPYDPQTRQQILDRAGRADYWRWAEQLDRCGACARPVRLRGRLIERSRTGDVVTYTTESEPDGVLLIRCGNRRAAVCRSCSFEYAGDAWHLIVAGISGGHKGVSAGVADHAKVFASLTAPSFGPVHTTPNDKHGRRARCRPRDKKALCQHGRPTWCMKVHNDDDPRLGEPLCARCYDYRAAAAFNWLAPELWRRFTITLSRVLARRCGMSARAFERLVTIQYAKVAEFQRRGVVHFHAIIRLDGRPLPDDEQWPTPWVDITAEQLAEAIHEAIGRVRVLADVGDGDGLILRFGEQVDAQPLTRRPDLDAGELKAEQVAAYVAKYATKAAEDLGLGERREVPDLYHARLRGLPVHVLRLLEAADQLGSLEDFAGIRRWLHMIGFRGHFATKSRRYSTTMGALRAERRTFRRHQASAELDQLHDPAHDDDPDGEDTTLVIAHWEFVGIGYLNAGDAALAASTAARARERRQAAADARRDHRTAHAA